MEITEEKLKEIQREPIFKGKIVSDSMSPVIKTGDIVVVEVKARDLKRFDIIVFYFENKLICHYCWSINQVMKPILIQTRNLAGGRDYPIAEKEYLGRVISHRLSFFRKIRLLFS